LEHYVRAVFSRPCRFRARASGLGGPHRRILAFAESLAFLSLLTPAWSALVAIGALVGAGSLDFAPIWIAGAAGAAFGDWIPFWFGYHYKDRASPLSQTKDPTKERMRPAGSLSY
jgi:membrane protein DedA with SNARE-associated domain